jgi:hypothetical protein
MNRALIGTLCELLQLNHCLTKEYSYGPMPIPVQVAGDDYGYLKNSYITADQLSDDPPQYKIVSGFGPTKEAVAQQLINLAQTQLADGTPALTGKQLRKQYPDPSIWPNETDVVEVKKRRAIAINYLIRDLCQPFEANGPALPVPQLVQQILMQLDQQEPINRDDDIQINIDALSEVTQDMGESKLVREVARGRLNMNYEWQAAMQMAAQQMQMPMGGNGDAAKPATQQAAQPSQQDAAVREAPAPVKPL